MILLLQFPDLFELAFKSPIELRNVQCTTKQFCFVGQEIAGAIAEVSQ